MVINEGISGSSSRKEAIIPAFQQSIKQTPVIPLYVWQALALPWRTEPEIDVERQMYLSERLAIRADSEQGIYPFQGVKLSRADIEWLLTTHEDADQRGPVDLSDERQQGRRGLDLRGADLRQVNLCGLPLARLQGGRNWLVQFPSTEEQHNMATIHLEGADLGATYLQEAFLGGAHMEEAFLGGAHLEGAYLEGAHLEGVNLEGAHLEGAHLEHAHLEGANLEGAYLESAHLLGAHLEGAHLLGAHLEGAHLLSAHLEGKPLPAVYLKRVRHWDKDILPPANLQGVFFSASTVLEDVILGDEHFGFVSLADVHWNGVNLSNVDWEAVTILGDERRAQQTSWLYNYRGAVRAYRQLASVLREQGLYEEASHFAYRAQLLQKRVLWRQIMQLRRRGRKGLGRLARKMVSYLSSWLFDLVAGYGYKPLRSLVVYVLVIGIFTLIYADLGMVNGLHQSLGELLTLSMTSFHGRGFFPDQLAMDGPQAFVATIEAVVGLVIELGFIAAFVQRFFRK